MADNRLRQSLALRRFAVTVEVLPPPRDESLAPALAIAAAIRDEPRVSALSIGDRVRSDVDRDPVQAALPLAEASGATPLVHLSGKDRRPEDLARSLGALTEAGIDNVLCVTGDRLKPHPDDRRVPFLDSVEAVSIARSLVPDALVAAGVSPFKYTEEETHNQYFKMARKHAAGARCLVTQVGWDMDKLDELQRYRRLRGFAQPVIANVMALTVGAARRIAKGAVPGVVVSDDLVALLEWQAQAPDRGRASRWDRLALQIVGAEQLGYAGVQLSGLTSADDVRRALDAVESWRARTPTRDAWRHAWEERLRLPDGAVATLGRAAGYRLFDGDAGRARPVAGAARRRYVVMSLVHAAAFDRRSPLFPLLRAVSRRIAPGSRLAGWLVAAEGAIKGPLVGCTLCGDCRLPETFYVCPETCPKGLANGPCGGSLDNRCEAGDRECVHALTYRLAAAAGRLHELEQGVVAGTPAVRGGSSWLRYFTNHPGERTRA